MNGKKTIGLSPCNSHVQLGVINPITSLSKEARNKLYNHKLGTKPQSNDDNNIELDNIKLNAQ